ncbi:MAG TPA: hypothetical protein ENN13_01600 [Candidatus Altiarchaeales archaeon]|nr:hypothetical protein [Candidatus Altiarchaeales archaeon]
MRDSRNNQMLVAILGFLFISILIFGAGSKYTVYIVVGLIVVLSFYFRQELGAEDSIGKSVKNQLAGLSSGTALTGNDKKVLIFHILTRLEERDSLNMEEFASEFDFPIYSLNSLVEWLEKRRIVKLTYPPMKNLPVLHLTDKGKSRTLRNQLYEVLAPKDLLGNKLKKEFARDITDFLAKHRRGK